MDFDPDALYSCPDCGSIYPSSHCSDCAALTRATADDPSLATIKSLEVLAIQLDRLTFLWGWLEDHDPELAQQAEAEYAAHNRALGRVR